MKKTNKNGGAWVALLILAFFTLLPGGFLTAQEVKVSGTVRDKDGKAVAGATVMEKGGRQGVTTDAEGRFALGVKSGQSTLLVSSIGYGQSEVPLAGRSNVEVLLTESGNSMDEVVVVGYGTQKKVSVTGSVSSIKGEELVRRPINSVEQALQGQLPGVTVLDKGGIPGTARTPLVVRGAKTLYTSEDLSGSATAPLVLVDGIEQPYSNINPDDIESISVLKDASSTAIYGSRASNGVMLITTKRGRSGKVSVSYNGFYALQNSMSKLQNMDLESYLNYQNLAYKNVGANPPYPYRDADIPLYLAGSQADPLRYPLPYNWYNTLLKTAPQTNHAVSVSGGNDNVKARMSIRHQFQDGIIDNTNSTLNEVRVNTDFRVNRKIKASADLNYRRENILNPYGLASIFQFFSQNGIWVVPQYPNGDYGGGPQGNNPKLLIEKGGYNRRIFDNVVGTLQGEWEILKGLKLSTQFAGRIINEAGKLYQTTWETKDSTTVKRRNLINSLTESRNNTLEYTLNSLLNYSVSFGDHDVKTLLGYSEIDNRGSNISAYRQNFYNNDIQSLTGGINNETQKSDGREYTWGLRSYFGRFNYAYANKYLFEANARYDGSSRFTGNNKYSFFPSFSLGWRLSREDFWAKSPLGKVFDEFKIRGSWGQTGNQAVALYSYFQTLNLVAYNFNNTAVQGYLQTQVANADLTWETTAEYNIGLDAELWNRRLSFTVDYYNKRTSGILLTLPVPGTLGLAPGPQNAGVIENKGVEFTLGTRNRFGAFGADANFNFSINNNKVLDLAGTGPFFYGTGGASGSGDANPRYIIGVGYPIYGFWGYRTNGMYQTDSEAAAGPFYLRTAKAGDVRYVDLNKDNVIDAKDQEYLGNSMPRYTYGGNVNLSWKQFSLNLTLQGVAAASVRLAGALGQQGNFEGLTADIVTGNYWTPNNTGARFPRPSKQDLRNQTNSDMFVLDASYFRLKNLQFVYQLPASFARKVHLNSANVFVSSTNLLTFSKLNEWNIDPESLSGVQNYYPQVAVSSIGVNLQF